MRLPIHAFWQPHPVQILGIVAVRAGRLGLKVRTKLGMQGGVGSVAEPVVVEGSQRPLRRGLSRVADRHVEDSVMWDLQNLLDREESRLDSVRLRSA